MIAAGEVTAALLSRALLSACRRSSGLIGLPRKSVAPFFMASTTFSGEEAPEMTITGEILSRYGGVLSEVSKPSLRGMIRSSSTAEMVPTLFSEVTQQLLAILSHFDRISLAAQRHFQIATHFQFIFSE